MLIKRNLLLICLSIFLLNQVSAQTNKYIGADKCKACHNKPATGEQYNKWLKDPHSKALKTLSNQASLDYAKKNGIANPAKEAKCLACHSTYEKAGAALRAGILPEEGVSCESCHGAGSAYKSPIIMKNQKQAIASGLILPTKEVCIKCHNKDNPFFKEFNFDTYAAKIAHPNPAAKKS
jgi:hypothetical protein